MTDPVQEECLVKWCETLKKSAWDASNADAVVEELKNQWETYKLDPLQWLIQSKQEDFFK